MKSRRKACRRDEPAGHRGGPQRARHSDGARHRQVVRGPGGAGPGATVGVAAGLALAGDREPRARARRQHDSCDELPALLPRTLRRCTVSKQKFSGVRKI
jgi:hypothetical protein